MPGRISRKFKIQSEGGMKLRRASKKHDTRAEATEEDQDKGEDQSRRDDLTERPITKPEDPPAGGQDATVDRGSETITASQESEDPSVVISNQEAAVVENMAPNGKPMGRNGKRRGENTSSDEDDESWIDRDTREQIQRKKSPQKSSANLTMTDNDGSNNKRPRNPMVRHQGLVQNDQTCTKPVSCGIMCIYARRRRDRYVVRRRSRPSDGSKGNNTDG